MILESNAKLFMVARKIALSGRRFAAVWIALLVSADAITASGQVISNSTAELVLATGSQQGLYYRIGQEIATHLQSQDINVRVIPSAGSIQNLELVASNAVQLCIAQADILRQQGASGDIQALMPLYTETVHILVRNPLRVRRLKDLNGKRISVGPAGGGTARNATAILEAAGIVRNDAVITHDDFAATSKALQGGEVDAAFVTMGCPSTLIEALMQNRCVFLLEPDRDILEKLLIAPMGLVLSSIPAGTYANQDGTIDTLGVPAMLSVRSDMDPALADRITRLVVDRLPDILRQSGIRADAQEVSARMAQIDVPVHPGARNYYEEQQKLFSRRMKHWVNIGSGPVFLALILLFIYKKADKISRLFYRYPASRALALLITLWLVGGLVMYYAERRLNDNYATIPLALWSAFVNWISFGSKEPISVVGRFNSTIMAILGMGSLSWLFSEVAAVFIRKRLNEANMWKNKRDHFVIINWNTMGSEVVRKIKAMQQEIGSIGEIVIVSKVPHETMREYSHLDRDPLAQDVVEITGMQKARSVIILSREDLPPDDSDTRNILIMMNLAKQFSKQSLKYPHIVVEMLNPGKVHLLSAVDLPHEVVSSQAVASDLIIQVAGNPGLTQIYSELLINGKNSNEIYSVPLDGKWCGKNFDDLCYSAAALRKKGIDVLPLAISRGGKAYVNPSRETIREISVGDVLFAVCDSPSDLKSLNFAEPCIL